MNKLFTLVAVAVLMAACGGNTARKAKVTEEKSLAETETVECCKAHEGCCGEEKACSTEEDTCCGAAAKAVAEE